MGVKDELRRAVDELAEDQAPAALAYLRGLLDDSRPLRPQTASDRLAQRMRPLTIPGRDFFAAHTVDLPTLMAEQGVSPVTDVSNLLGAGWPEDEPVEPFVTTIRRRRHEDGCA